MNDRSACLCPSCGAGLTELSAATWTNPDVAAARDAQELGCQEREERAAIDAHLSGDAEEDL